MGIKINIPVIKQTLAHFSEEQLQQDQTSTESMTKCTFPFQLMTTRSCLVGYTICAADAQMAKLKLIGLLFVSTRCKKAQYLINISNCALKAASI